MITPAERARLPDPAASVDAYLLQALLDAMTDSAVFLDSTGHYRAVNAAFLTSAGRTRDDVLGRTVADVFGARAGELYEPITARILSGEEIRWEGWAREEDAPQRYVEETIQPFRPDPDGPVLGMIAITRDFTGTRLLNGAIDLHDTDSFSRLCGGVVSECLDGIVIIDEEGCLIYMNPAAEALFGYRNGEVSGRQIADLIIPEGFRRPHLDGMKAYLKTGVTRVMGSRLKLDAMHATGASLPIELAITEISGNGISGFGRRYFSAHVRDLGTSQSGADGQAI